MSDDSAADAATCAPAPARAIRVAAPLLAFITYSFTAGASLAWLDAGELTAASLNLGVAHPPGEPPPVLFARLVAYLPLGDLAFRVALASALAVAAAVALLARATELGLARVAPGLCPVSRAGLGAAAGLAFGWSWAAWFQGVRAEVYGLEAALLLGVLVLLLDDADDGRRLRTAALLAGLAIATHSLVALAFLAPCALGVLIARRPAPRRLATSLLLALLTFAAVVSYLPLRAARDPSPNWGDPDSPSRLAWVLQAKAFQKSLHHDAPQATSFGHELAQVTGALVEQAAPWGALAALVALYLFARRRETRALAIFGAVLLACTALPPALVAFDPDNPDAYGYLMPAIATVVWLAVLAIGALADLVRTAAPKLVPTAAVAIALLYAGAQAALHAPDASLRHGDRAERWARALLDVPPRAVVVTSYFESAFLVLGLRAVEGARPDVTHVDRAALTQPGERDAARRRDPELGPVLDAGLEVTHPWPLAALTTLAARRPVHVESFDDAPPELALTPPTPWILSRVADALVPGRDALGLRRLLLVAIYSRARSACDGHLHAPADASQPLLGALALLAPDDPDAAALRETCRSR